MLAWLDGLPARIWQALPQGGTLSEELWRRRHRGFVLLLWLHVLAFVFLGLHTGHELLHTLGEVSIVGTLAALAQWGRLSRVARSALATIGLVTCSALLVHYTGGLIEAHFHFFVVIPLIALYADWTPFLIALGYTVAHHGVLGTLHADSVYNHPAAREAPWLWAGVHGGFVLAAAVASVITWKLNEEAARTAELARVSRRYETILNSSGDGIYGMNLDGTLTFVNPAAAQMIGSEVEELIGRPAQAWFRRETLGDPPGGGEDPTGGVEAVTRRGADATYVRRDGTSFPVEYAVTPITEGARVVGTVVVFRDITERRAIERLKDEFVSVVSHELRTPLTSIKGSLGLLAGGVVGELPPKGERMVSIALNNTDRLVRLINDILDIERMAAGTMVMQPIACNLGVLVDQAIEGLGSMAQDAGVVLAPASADVWVFADPDRIAQTLTNLLSNAVKFSPAGGRVTVSAKPHGSEILVRVRDQGRGIPDDQLEAVFERFHQLNSSDSRDKGGTGLGLAICRSIVEHHGGRIWADSELGQGTTFSFTLPAALAHAGPGTESPAPARDLTVLVCDDDPSVLEVVQMLLNQHGYQAITATSGQEALRKAASLRPAVVLLDLMMPGMSGWETLAALKEQPETSGIPVVILSALEADNSDGLSDEVAGWITKTADEAALLRALNQATAERRGQPMVLVVEDDDDLAGVLVASFEYHGLSVARASTGREAIWLAEELFPDLLVLDLGLPDVDGFSVIDSLRRGRRLADVPVVIYTATELDDGERARLRLGETIYLTKSKVTPEQFEHRVLKLLGRVTTGEQEGEQREAPAHHR